MTFLSPEARQKLPIKGSTFKKLLYIFQGFVYTAKQLQISGDSVKLDELIEKFANSDSFDDVEDAKMKLLKIVDDFDSDNSSLICVLRLIELFTLHKGAGKQTDLQNQALLALERSRQIFEEMAAGLSETVAIVKAVIPDACTESLDRIMHRKRASGYGLFNKDSSLYAVVMIQCLARLLIKVGPVLLSINLLRKLFGAAQVTDEQLKAFYDKIRDAAIAFESKPLSQGDITSSKLVQILIALEIHRAKLK